MPERHAPIPYFTLALIGLIALVAFAVGLDPYLLPRLSFHPTRPTPLQALTSLFLHVDILHLLGNLIFLAAVGPAVEYSAGRKRFLLVYFISGFAGIAAHWALSAAMGWSAPLSGASGAIAGCVGFAAVRYMSLRVPILPGVGAPVSVIVLVWVALQGAGAVLGSDNFGMGTAYWVHLAGFIVGLALALGMGSSQRRRGDHGHRVLDEMNLRGPAAALAAAERHLAEQPSDVKALRHKAEALSDLGRPTDAAAAYVHLLRTDDEAARVDALTALEGLGRLDALSATDRLRLVDDLKGEPDLAKSLLVSIVEGPTDEPRRPDAILELALLQEPKQARVTAELLAGEYALHPATAAARAKGLLD